MIAQNEYSQKVGVRIHNERLAVDISACVHELFYNRGVEIVLFRNQLRDKSSSQILELHQYANDFVGKAISVDNTLEMLQALKLTAIENAKIDIGKLTHEWRLSEDTADAFIINNLSDLFRPSTLEPRDVVLFGFGRIGRLLARELIVQEGSGNQLRLRAVAVRSINAASLHKRASLLKIDSVHGDFPGTVLVDEENMAQNKQRKTKKENE